MFSLALAPRGVGGAPLASTLVRPFAAPAPQKGAESPPTLSFSDSSTFTTPGAQVTSAHSAVSIAVLSQHNLDEHGAAGSDGGADSLFDTETTRGVHNG